MNFGKSQTPIGKMTLLPEPWSWKVSPSVVRYQLTVLFSNICSAKAKLGFSFKFAIIENETGWSRPGNKTTTNNVAIVSRPWSTMGLDYEWISC